MSASDEEEMMNQQAEAGPSSAAQSSLRPEDAALPNGMSKNAMKKAARKAREYAMRPEKRAAEKARKRERNKMLREQYDTGTMDPADKVWFEKRKMLKRARQEDSGKGRKMRSKAEFGGGVIIDLGFDELMHPGEVTSLGGQLSFCYSANRLAQRPFKTVIHSSFGPTASPRVWGRMENRGWQNWTRSYWREQGLDEIAKAVKANQTAEGSSQDQAAEQPREQQDNTDLTQYLAGPILPPTITPSHSLVYLSADAHEELTTLSENEIYIIGGVVDRNRYKFMCQQKAEKLGIRTARLPIGTFLAEMPTRKVLTVNQVFEILTQYLDQNDWRKAFETVIPNRKYDEVGKKAMRRQFRRERIAAGESVGDLEDGDAAEDSDDAEDDLEADLGEESEERVTTGGAQAELTPASPAGQERPIAAPADLDALLEEEESMNM